MIIFNVCMHVKIADCATVMISLIVWIAYDEYRFQVYYLKVYFKVYFKTYFKAYFKVYNTLTLFGIHVSQHTSEITNVSIQYTDGIHTTGSKCSNIA